LEVKPSVFGFEWHDSLVPVGPNYTAIERAIFECACAGCESIWITANDDWAPLIKKRIGNYVYDPIWYYREYDRFGRESRKIIPIFCVPHFVKYRDRRDSLGWGILNAAIYAKTVARSMSDIISPDMFYAAFPFGVYNPRELSKHRKKISSSQQCYLTYNGKTIKDGERLGFTFSWEDLREINRHINREGTGLFKRIGEFVKGDPKAWTQRRVPEEQYSARYFPLEEVFKPLKIADSNFIELSWNYDISSWENYRKFMGSEHVVKKPAPLTEEDILHPVGVDDERTSV